MEAKIDHALLEAAQGAAAARGVPFHLFSPDGPSGYDPLAHGSVDERSERLIAVESWGSADAGFYRQAASPFLRLVLRVLDAGSEPVTLASVARHCDPDELINLASAGGDQEVLAEVTPTIAGLQGDQQRAVAGLRARLQNLASSDLARAWLDPSAAPRPSTCARRSPGARSSTSASTPIAPATSAGRSPRWSCSTSAPPPAPLMGEGVGTFVGDRRVRGAGGTGRRPPLRARAGGRFQRRGRHPDARRPARRRARGPRADRRDDLGDRLSPDRRAGRCGVGGAADRRDADLAVDDPHRPLRAPHLGGHPHPRLPLRGQPVSSCSDCGPGRPTWPSWIAAMRAQLAGAGRARLGAAARRLREER